MQSPPYFIVIDRALRDEGTSYHYLPPTDYSSAEGDLVELAKASLTGAGIAVRVGATWTTDAPFRETAEAIVAAREAGILAVEMEAAALYAFATARQMPVLCLAHVTNQMGRIEGDFEKGADDGAEEALDVRGLRAAGTGKHDYEPGWPTRAERVIISSMAHNVYLSRHGLDIRSGLKTYASAARASIFEATRCLRVIHRAYR